MCGKRMRTGGSRRRAGGMAAPFRRRADKKCPPPAIVISLTSGISDSIIYSCLTNDIARFLMRTL